MRKYGFFFFVTLILFISCNSSGKETQINAKLRETYDTERLKGILQSARESIFHVWNNGQMPILPHLGTNEGLAVRLIVNGKDRGCLAWYKNSGDMNLFAEFCAAQALKDPRYEPLRPEEAGDTLVEVLIFGNWEDMSTPEDFIPGSHNLWLADGNENTILQASIAVQRHHTKKDFLEKICLKAGLDKNAWSENKNMVWRRSAAIWIIEPLLN
jgi:uncharacterized protein